MPKAAVSAIAVRQPSIMYYWNCPTCRRLRTGRRCCQWEVKIGNDFHATMDGSHVTHVVAVEHLVEPT